MEDAIVREDQIATLRMDEYHGEPDSVPEPTVPVIFTGSDDRTHRIDPAEEKTDSQIGSNTDSPVRPVTEPIRVTSEGESSSDSQDDETFGVGLD